MSPRTLLEPVLPTLAVVGWLVSPASAEPSFRVEGEFRGRGTFDANHVHHSFAASDAAPVTVSESAAETGSKGNQGWGGTIAGSAAHGAVALTVEAEAWDDDGRYGSSAAATSVVESGARAVTDDLVIRSTSDPDETGVWIPVSMRIRLSGGITWEEDGFARIDLLTCDHACASWKRPGRLETGSADGVLDAGFDPSSFEGTFEIPLGQIEVGVPTSVGLGLEVIVRAIAESPGRMASSAVAELPEGLRFVEGEPVFVLPEGYTASSASARILDNRWHGNAPDGDGDGIPDSLDNCPGGANADQEDTDGDGVGDACDVCACTADPDQRDSDRDGFGDACDATEGAGTGTCLSPALVSDGPCGSGAATLLPALCF